MEKRHALGQTTNTVTDITGIFWKRPHMVVWCFYSRLGPQHCAFDYQSSLLSIYVHSIATVQWSDVMTSHDIQHADDSMSGLLPNLRTFAALHYEPGRS